MSGSSFTEREAEFQRLLEMADRAAKGRGATIILGGSAGIGKSWLVDKVAAKLEAENFKVLRGVSLPESFVPLLPFKEALRSVGLHHVATGGKPPRILKLYLMDDSGILLAQYSRSEENLDSDIFAGMLTAVESFVKDSLSELKEKSAGGLRHMGYGDYTIIMEHGSHVNFVAIIEGQENEFLRHDMRKLLGEIEEKHRQSIHDFQNDSRLGKTLEKDMITLVESKRYEGVDYSGDDPRIKQENLFDNIMLGIQRESEDFPLLMILEDLHWADPTSLGFMNYLARNITENRICMVGTYRPEEMVSTRKQRHHPLKTAIENMRKEELLCEMDLQGIEEMAEVIAAAMGRHNLSHSFLDRIKQDLGGNPFYTIEFIRLLHETGKLQKSVDGAWVLAVPEEDIDFPSRLSDILKHRLSRLREEHLLILESASISGDEFDTALVGTIAGINRIKLLKSLSELEKNHRLIDNQKGYTFGHAKMRETIYESLPDELRREYHTAIAEAYERLFPEEINELSDKLAQHFHAAMDPRAAEYGVNAGVRFRREYANQEAIEMYNIVLDVIPEEDTRWSTSMEAKGELLLLIGRYDDAVKCFDHIMARTHDPMVMARCRRNMGTAKVRTGRLHDALEEYAKGISGRDVVDLERGKLLVGMSYVLNQIGTYEESIKLIQEAVQIFMENNAPVSLIADARKVEALTSTALGRWEYAEGLYKSLIESLNSAPGEHWMTSAIYNNYGQLQCYTGRLAEALESFEHAVELMDLVGDKRNLSVITANYCWVLKEMGRFEDAKEMLVDMEKTSRAINDMWLKFTMNNNLLDIAIRQGNCEGTDKYLENCRSAMQIMGENVEEGVFAFLHSYLLTSLGRPKEGEAEARRALAIGEKYNMQRVKGMAAHFIGFSLDAQGRHEEAIQAYLEALGMQSGQHLEETRTLMRLGITEMKLGMLEGKGRVEAALEEFEKMGALWDAENARITLE